MDRDVTRERNQGPRAVGGMHVYPMEESLRLRTLAIIATTQQSSQN